MYKREHNVALYECNEIQTKYDRSSHHAQNLFNSILCTQNQTKSKIPEIVAMKFKKYVSEIDNLTKQKNYTSLKQSKKEGNCNINLSYSLVPNYCPCGSIIIAMRLK